MNRPLLMSAAFALALAGAPAFAMPSGHKMDHPTTEPAGAMEHADHCGMPMGEGEITALDVAKAKVKISHKPITSIGWSAMTMEFGVLKSVDLAAFGAGALHYADHASIADALRPLLDARTTVLVKGSRFMRMERVAAALLAHTGQDNHAS